MLAVHLSTECRFAHIHVDAGWGGSCSVHGTKDGAPLVCWLDRGLPRGWLRRRRSEYQHPWPGLARVKGMLPSVIDTPAYLMQHDADHRGPICMLARDWIPYSAATTRCGGEVEKGALMWTHSQLQSPGRALLITPWERRVLQLLANGYTTYDVAADLGVDTLECETLLTRLFAVMGAATQAEAIAAAHRRGLLTRAPTKSIGSGEWLEARVGGEKSDVAPAISTVR
jgi:DNA-binding CsgD family transcriptional regulator